LKLIFKLICGKECIADCVPSFELVCSRKYCYGDCCRKNSMAAIFTASRRKNSQLAIFMARRKRSRCYFTWKFT